MRISRPANVARPIAGVVFPDRGRAQEREPDSPRSPGAYNPWVDSWGTAKSEPNKEQSKVRTLERLQKIEKSPGSKLSELAKVRAQSGPWEKEETEKSPGEKLSELTKEKRDESAVEEQTAGVHASAGNTASAEIKKVVRRPAPLLKIPSVTLSIPDIFAHSSDSAGSTPTSGQDSILTLGAVSASNAYVNVGARNDVPGLTLPIGPSSASSGCSSPGSEPVVPGQGSPGSRSKKGALALRRGMALSLPGDLPSSPPSHPAPFDSLLQGLSQIDITTILEVDVTPISECGKDPAFKDPEKKTQSNAEFKMARRAKKQLSLGEVKPKLNRNKFMSGGGFCQSP